jgi:heme/copper-type cytochrome/quinol oxidase subunit 2
VTLGTLIVALSFILLPMLDGVIMTRDPKEVVVRISILESGGFNPEVITVKKGEPVKLTLISMDVSHSIVMESFGIETEVLHPGKSTVIEFTPDKSGIYMFKCNTECSQYHHFMRGKIIVED